MPNLMVRPHRNYARIGGLVILVNLILTTWRLHAPLQPVVNALIINEFVADNQTGLMDEDGDYSDWLELYNTSPNAINLAHFTLTDDPEAPQKWPLPDITLNGHDYLLIFASGKDRSARLGELHTNFKLNHTGEFLALYHRPSSQFVNQWADFPPQFSDIAYGRQGSYGDGYLSQSTPNQPNNKGWLAPTVHFSHERGLYEHPFNLTLTTSLTATLRYTTDGSPPMATHGQTYHGPIPITQTTIVRAIALKPNFQPSRVETYSYLFPQTVLTQPNNPTGFPATWGRHGDDYDGHVPGSPVQADYGMDAAVVGDGAAVREALYALPTVSLVMKRQHWVELYTNPRERGLAWERPMSIELFDPQQRWQPLQIDAGGRIHGNAGRRENMPKHSFRLFFRGLYGAAKLEYPLFPNSSVERFDTLVLRAGADRSYAGWTKSGYDFRLTTYARDEWMRASQIELSQVGSHGMFVHLYVNGLYWGIYNVVERPDESFAAAHLGGQKAAWYVRNHSGEVSGRPERIEQLMQTLVARGGLDNLSGDERYALLQTYVDIEHFIDYVLLNWYAGTTDWPSNNWYANVQNPDGKIRMVVWDAEHSWIDGARITLGRSKAKNLVKFLFDALIPSAEFRIKLADRAYQSLHHDGPLTDQNSQARWLRLNQPIEAAIPAEAARWGDVRYESPITLADWYEARDKVMQQMDGNATKLIGLMRQEGYYPLLDPPQFSQHGGLIAAGDSVALSADAGVIYYTNDGSDPRQLGGEVAEQAQWYQKPLIISQTTHLKARLWQDGVWSGLHQATFHVSQPQQAVKIVEIMYNPLGGNDEEFLVLQNVGQEAVSLAGAFFEGIGYTFPVAQPALAPGETITLVSNQTAFAQRYPHGPLTDEYRGHLSNDGETITLRDPHGRIITEVTYDDENGWPLSADGRGDSLVLHEIAPNLSQPQHWRAGEPLAR